MSTTIDQRVVEMRFDNKQFESATRTSMSTLEKLKQSLNLTGASKGLENINTAAKKVNFSGITSGIETVQVKFSYLQASIQHQLNRIVDSTVNAGKRMVSALTIDPIKTGFSEYETQINAVQTILANTSSKGTTLQQVNSALDTLNTYADKTIYNFTEMTRNIGTFTAAGVDLDKSVSAIQGIANLAAVSGSTSQQASTAMYQLSQALAAGRVSLMDWNSVVNAGMGGQVFQDALKTTAKTMGIVVDESKSFRESISGGDTWLSSEVLIKTLEQFTMAAEEGSEEWEKYKKSLMDDGYTEEQANSILKMANTATDAATKVKTFTQLWDTLKESAQSGWTQTWEIIVGDFGEAKEFLTKISDTIGSMIGASAEVRNELLSGGLSSGWKQLLGAGIADEAGYQDSIKSIAKEHGIAFDEIIKKTEEAGGTFEDALISCLKDGSISSDMMTESVSHLANSMRNMTEEERDAAGYTKEHIKSIEELEKGLKNGSISMDEFVKKMSRPSGRENLIESLWNSFNALMEIIKPIKEAFREIFPPMTGEQLYTITENIRKLTENFEISSDTADKIKRTFKGVFAIIDIGVKAVSALFSVFSKLTGHIAPAGEGILGFTANIGDFLVKLNDSIGKFDIFNKAIEKIGEFLAPIAEGVKEFGKTIANTFDDISIKAETRLEPLTIIGNFIKNIFVGLGKIIGKIAPIFASLATALGGVFSDLTDNIAKNIQGADYSKLFDIFNSGVFAAIGVFIAKFMKSASDIVGDASGFVEGIQDIFGGVSDALNAFTGSLKAETLKKIAISIGILAASLLVLAMIDSDKLAGSLGAITVLFVELMGSMTLFANIVDGSGKGFKNITTITAALLSISAALLVLSVAMKIMSTMSWSEMAVGLISISVGLGALVGALWLLPEGKFDKASKAIKKLTSALLIFAIAMKIMGSLSWKELAVGLTGTVVGLGALVGALHLLPKNMTGKAAGVLILSTSMIVLASALKLMATMSWDEIGRSLAVLAGSLLILSGALNLMKSAIPGALAMLIVAPALIALGGALKTISSMSWDEIARGLVALAGALMIIATAMAFMKTAIFGAAALIVVVGALTLLAPVMKILGSMSWGEVVRGLTSLAGVFVILGIAGAVLGPLIPTITSLAGSIALLGLGCAAIGAGVFLVGAGITALSAALATGGVAITVFISSLIGLIPYLIEQIGVGIIKLCEVIAGSASAICEAVAVIVVAAVDALVAAVPALAEGILVLITELLTKLVEYTPKIVSSLFDFLIGVIDAIGEKIPDLVQAGVNLLMNVFQGVIDALNSIDPKVLVNGILAIGLMTALVTSMAAIALLTPAAMIGVLGFGAVITELSFVLASVGALSRIPGLEWLINEGGQLLGTIGVAIGQFVGGIVGGMMSGVSGQLPKIGADLSSFMSSVQPFIDGAKSIDPSALEGVKSLAGIILTLTAANILEGLTSWFTGGSSLSKFGEEIAAFAPCIKTYADTVKGIDASAVESSANAAKALAEMAKNLPNSGGLAGFFAGENDLSTFAEQLEPFGKCMKNYADAVSGLDADAVVNSATAAKALAELANNLPNSGGIAGFFAGENDISSFGTQLVPFGLAMKQYSDAIAGIDSEAIINSATAGKALSELANTLPNSGGVAGFFAGENDISSFGTQLVVFGEGMKSYADSISGIDTEAVANSAVAAKTLAELADNLPNSGGVLGFFAGENDISSFGTQLVSFGEGLSDYADSISGIDADSVIKSATAGEALASLVENLPDTGGLKAFFTGDKDIGNLGEQLVPFGEGMKKYSDAIAGIDPASITNSTTAAKSLLGLIENLPKSGGMIGGISAFFTGAGDTSFIAEQLEPFGKGMKQYSDAIAGINSEAVTNSVTAAKALSELANNLPNNGGLTGLLIGDNSIGTFGDMLVPFGEGMKRYADSINGMDSEAVINSATAGKALSELVNTLPNSGGIASFFTGDNSISSFVSQLLPFGMGMKAYSLAVSGIDSEAIINSATAGKALTELFNSLPKDGGMFGGMSAFFTGENSISSFVSQLLPFGMGMKAYSLAVSGIDPEAIANSVTAGKALTELINNLPKDGGMLGGISAFFTGENSASLFAAQLLPFGMGMKAYSLAISGIDPEAITNSATAAKALVELANNLPNSGGVVGFFTGENDMSIFSSQLLPFGKGMKQYADSVAGIDPESVNNSVTAAKALSELINNMPSSGGITGFFSGLLNGESDMSVFTTQLVPFGKGMKQYANAVAGIDPESVNNSVTAGKALAELANNLPNSGGLVSIFTGDSSIATLGTQLVPFGKGMKQYSDAVAGIDSASVNNSINLAKRLIDIINSMAGLNTKGVGSFVTAINELGQTSVDKFINAFNNSSQKLSNIGMNLVASISKGVETKKSVLVTASLGLVSDMIEKINTKNDSFNKAGVKLLESLIKGIKSQKTDVTNAIKSSVSDGDDAIRKYYDNFYKAGSYLVDGFAAGIKANTFKAEAKAAAMAEAALAAAEEALGIQSPSKEFYGVGDYAGQGFVNALVDYGIKAYKAGGSMADEARKGLTSAIQKVNDFITNDIDAQPTIRPILDLSDVEAGAGAINGLFNSRNAVGVMANVGAISTMMNRSSQNGANDDVVSAIDKLRRDLGNIGGPTYNVGDVTYDNDSTVSTAVESLIRAVRVERRR